VVISPHALDTALIIPAVNWLKAFYARRARRFPVPHDADIAMLWRCEIDYRLWHDPSVPATARVGPEVEVKQKIGYRRAATFRNGRETVRQRCGGNGCGVTARPHTYRSTAPEPATKMRMLRSLVSQSAIALNFAVSNDLVETVGSASSSSHIMIGGGRYRRRR